MRNTGPHVCPRCGERVSAFAAGCAICGAELDPHRADGSQLSIRLASWLRALRLPRAGGRDPVRR